MKKLFFFYAVSIMLLPACNNDKKQTSVSATQSEKEKVTVDENETDAARQAVLGKKVEELNKLLPLSLDLVKALLPEELAGMKRNTADANNSMGFSAGQAEYVKDDTAKIRLSIFDCAGEAGSGFYSVNYWNKLDNNTENEKGYTKTIDFNGGKAIEGYDKETAEYRLMYLSGDRYLVGISGERTGLDAVKAAAKSLDIK
jgi:hypothetical protein